MDLLGAYEDGKSAEVQCAHASKSSSAFQPSFPQLPGLPDPTNSSLIEAVHELRGGGVVSFPTETVYGLGADARNAQAVARIYAAKGRPSDNPLIVHIAHTAQLDSVCDTTSLPPAYNVLMQRFWPGSLTMLMPVRPGALPSIVTAGLQTVGIRMPSHPLARRLIAQSECPLAAPSSNASGRPSPTCAQHVYYDLGGPLDHALSAVGGGETPSNATETLIPEDMTGRGRIPLILDGGQAGVGLESTVVDGLSDRSEIRVLRPGGVAVEDIEAALQSAGLLASRSTAQASAQSGLEKESRSEAGNEGHALGQVHVRVYGRDMVRDEKQEATPSTPGMKYRHYSPTAPVLALEVQPSAELNLAEVVAQEYVALAHAQEEKKGNDHHKKQESNEGPSSTKAKGSGQELASDYPLSQAHAARPTFSVGLMASQDSELIHFIKSRADPSAATNLGAEDGPRSSAVWRLTLPLHSSSEHLFFSQDSAESRYKPEDAAGTVGTVEAIIYIWSMGTRDTSGDEASRRLFSGLRRLDEPAPLMSRRKGCDLILVETLPRDHMGLAFMNRLDKAASARVEVRPS